MAAGSAAGSCCQWRLLLLRRLHWRALQSLPLLLLLLPDVAA
jgi:hypothetical protein